jgi:hypothetical protein
MHKSRLAGFIIDCQNAEAELAAQFWGPALGLDALGLDGPAYLRLDASSRDMTVEVQRVSHESRVHLDIESDDVEAEVARLEVLGARRIANVKSWVVLEAPTGQRFCVVQAKVDLEGRAGTRAWR